MDKCHFPAYMVIALCCNACVNIDKPQAVALCSAAHNCSDNPITKDASAKPAPDASGPDANGPSPLDALKADQSPVLADAARDAAGSESAAETSSEAGYVAGPEPTHGIEATAEPGPEPATALEPGPELGAESVAESGPEPRPEAGTEPGTEPGPEAGAEPGAEAGAEPGREPGPEPGLEAAPESGPEPPRDAGTVASCPSGGICDDFEDGNYSANPPWTTPGGFIVTTDGSKVLAYRGTDTPAVALVGNQATALTIRAKVKATAFGATSNSYRVGVFARANSQGTPSAWYGFTITGDGSLRLQVTDSTPAGCGAVDGAAVAATWYILTLTVGGTVAATTLQGTLTDAAGGNAKTIGPCTVTGGLGPGWAGVGVRGAGTQGEWDDVQITGITP